LRGRAVAELAVAVAAPAPQVAADDAAGVAEADRHAAPRPAGVDRRRLEHHAGLADAELADTVRAPAPRAAGALQAAAVILADAHLHERRAGDRDRRVVHVVRRARAELAREAVAPAIRARAGGRARREPQHRERRRAGQVG